MILILTQGISINEGVTKGVNEGVIHGCVIIITFIHDNEELIIIA